MGQQNHPLYQAEDGDVQEGVSEGSNKEEVVKISHEEQVKIRVDEVKIRGDEARIRGDEARIHVDEVVVVRIPK